MLRPCTATASSAHRRLSATLFPCRRKGETKAVILPPIPAFPLSGEGGASSNFKSVKHLHALSIDIAIGRNDINVITAVAQGLPHTIRKKMEVAMGKLGVFNLVTLDGYFAGQGGDISWHNVDAEFQEYAEKASNSGNTLLFGRKTYDLMRKYWPTPEALKNDPVVAKGMNDSKKIVFSRKLDKADWSNTRLVKGDLIEEVRKLKEHSGKDLTILGSGSIVAQLTQAGLIDEYQILLNPVVLGKGKTLFEGVDRTITLKLVKSHAFSNGNIMLYYELAK
jgi:dihydrofolate reductase